MVLLYRKLLMVFQDQAPKSRLDSKYSETQLRLII